MKAFMDGDFLLQSNTARRLFGICRDLPIIDYHCHLNPKEIAEDKRFDNITEIWLGGDHYKWRAMRACGVPEAFITGCAPPEEKFKKWAETIPQCIGNPLFHWTHLELRRYFGYGGVLSPGTAGEVWRLCNERLRDEDFSVSGILTKFNVESLCTTDDPADSLEYHRKIRGAGRLKTVVTPTFRPRLDIEKPGFAEYAETLSAAAGVPVTDYENLLAALTARADWFHQNGCRLSDHALDPPVYAPYSKETADKALKSALNGQVPETAELHGFKSALITDLSRVYASLGWVMQLHAGALRGTNTAMTARLGPDTGYDTMDDRSFAAPLAALLNGMNAGGHLPKTILYCLNPKDNYTLAALTGCFQDGETAGKLQFGSGWWFNDHKDGMLQQMSALASQGVFSRFVGMLTDSRSFLSYPRHEYFRRLLCGFVGNLVEEGEYPADFTLLEPLVRGVAYENARGYFPRP